MAKILFVIAPVNFRDEELFHTRDVLKEHDIEISSLTTNTAKGTLGGEIKPDLDVHSALEKTRQGVYDAVIFVGGPGCKVYFDHHASIEIIKTAFSQGKVVASICLAGIILANSGILKNKKATVWDSGDGSNARHLQNKGATFVDEDVFVDGNIVTANGPEAAKAFGESINKLL